MLPAHAQTTPPDGGGEPPVGGDCTLNSLAAWALLTSFSSSITVIAEGDCGSTATVQVRNSDGELLVECTNPTSAFGVGGSSLSWSCSGNTSIDVSNGDSVTFNVEFSGGCSCRFVASAE
jgi:hypothetical protein